MSPSRTKKPPGPKIRKTESHLPGDLSGEALIARILRVDQAGEYGAKRIYEGQLAVLAGTEDEPIIRKMLEQELEHLKEFDNLVANRKVRPTALQPLWHVAGYALGVSTALLGREAAMACTVAVEEVIDEHYASQSEQLSDDEQDLRNKIEKFRSDEQHHRDIGLEQGAESAPAYPVLTRAIKTGSRIAIWLSSRI